MWGQIVGIPQNGIFPVGIELSSIVGMWGPHIGRSSLQSPQSKTVQSPQEKCYFVGIPHILPTFSGKVLLKQNIYSTSWYELPFCGN